MLCTTVAYVGKACIFIPLRGGKAGRKPPCGCSEDGAPEGLGCDIVVWAAKTRSTQMLVVAGQ